MATELTKETVRTLFERVLDECDLYGKEGKYAERLLCYIEGARDMEKSVIDAIDQAGTSNDKKCIQNNLSSR